MDTIEMLLKAIEYMKRRIIALESDPNIDFKDKHDQLDFLRRKLVSTSSLVCVIMEDHLEELRKGA